MLGLEEPTQGSVKIFDKDLYKDFTPDSIADFRKNTIGMVYQQPYWIKSLNVEENAALPLRLFGIPQEKRLLEARRLLKNINMLDWAKYNPSELSSGQQQKVSLCRALISNPQIIIADEPTGNLDFESGEELILTLKKVNKEDHKTIIMVTHDLEYLGHADICIRLLNGAIQKIFSPSQDPEEIRSANLKKNVNERI